VIVTGLDAAPRTPSGDTARSRSWCLPTSRSDSSLEPRWKNDPV
jgi:hypothetical protein